MEHSKEIVLVLGGARSGKSSWALNHVEREYRSRLFLATAEVRDQEMAERVHLHQEARGPEWVLVEEPLEIPDVLTERCRGGDGVLIDCLTMWLSNIMLQEGETHVDSYKERFFQALKITPAGVVMVSNEVGMGIVPEHPLGRAFRDAAGLLNQQAAAISDRVVLMVAGCPLWLKGGEGREKNR